MKLEQAQSVNQSKIKDLLKLVNATVNAAGHNKTNEKLTRKLQRETAHHFEVGKANHQEARRAAWTTQYNLNTWYSTWKQELIELGFGREKTAADVDVEGELVITEEQKRHIVNVDETDGSLDETTGQRGGRPPP